MTSELRFRQVHLDFHTSEHIPDVGARFDAEKFVATLKRGHVNSVTVFARCHHGWAYYPSKVCKPHPHLQRNLTGEMVAACRKHDINVPIYISVQWDERMAREHPGWRVVHAEQEAGSSLYQLKPQWHTLCLSNDEYVEYLIAHTREVIELFEPDGLFFDILGLWRCVCPKCLARMAAAGRDGGNEKDQLANHRELVLGFYERMGHAVRAVAPGMRMFFNSGHIYKGERERWKYFSHLELESLPTGGWGYDHFPVSARYASTLGLEYVGMTGKFHTSWGEFGGYKRPVALEYECMWMVALGARCSIGDQMHPCGELEEATYATIAPAYERVAAIEPYLKDARPMSEVAILSSEGVHHARGVHEESDCGAARILLELHVMFDVIDAEEDFASYKVIVLPDDITLEGELAKKVRAYVENGGKLLLSGASGMRVDLSGFAVPLRAEVQGMSEWLPDYVEVQDGLDSEIVRAPFVMYQRAYKVRACGAEVLAQARRPYFNRSWERFCSHQHAPYSLEKDAGYDALMQDGNIMYFSHPIFLAYYEKGQPLYKYMVRGALRRLLPEWNVEVALPSSGRISLMRQEEPKRTLLHLLYAQPQLRGERGFGWGAPQKIEIIEDVVPLYGVRCRVRFAKRPKRVYAASTGNELEWTYADGYVRFVVERVYVHELVVMDET
ncbi:MAG: beta-galactosidase trimerization domain-containing protein [bacterium]|nr:beta-galactosidase trimerization domain-containing protein [bacterium]